jgi:hypothetical protein
MTCNDSTRDGDSPICDMGGFSPSQPPSPYTDGMTEAWSPPASLIPSDVIAKAIADRWTGDGTTAVEVLAPNIIYLRQQKLVECVFDDARSAYKMSNMFKRLRKAGAEVVIILPMSEIGRAHEEFWGTGMTLQGWIHHGDGMIRFAGPEVA